MAAKFQLVSEYSPAGDQPKAIAQLADGYATASGSRYCSAPPAPARPSRPPTSSPQLSKPTLVLAHNKTLAAQLYKEFKGFFPQQRRPLLRQLLRLLPARSLHPAARHLHRERRVDQREHRPPAPGRDQRPRQPRGRHHRRQRLVHLRPRFAERLQADDGLPHQGRDRSIATTCCSSSSTSSTSATTSPSSAASSASAATSSRSGRRPKSSPFASNCSATRSMRSPSSTRLTGETIRDARRAVHLPGQALRHAGGAHPRGGRGHRAGAERPARAVPQRGQAARGRNGCGPACRYDLEMLREVGYCSGIENYARWFSGRKPGRAAVHADRLLPRGFPADRR